MNGHRSNYNLQELNLICEHPQLYSRPGAHRRSGCVIYLTVRKFSPRNEYRGEGRGGDEVMSKSLLSGQREQEDTRYNRENSRS